MRYQSLDRGGGGGGGGGGRGLRQKGSNFWGEKLSLF